MRWRTVLYGLLVVAVAGIGIGARVMAALPIPEPAAQDLTTVVFDRRGHPIGQLHAEQHRIALPLESISPVLLDAVVASEDRDFFTHPGVDPLAIARAAWVDIRQRGQLQGGSTITQQYVKNVYLDADRTLVRKLREAFFAVRLERELSKAEILERYLNTIYFGRGAYGVEAAAQVWFGVSAGSLDVAQSAYLAALIRAPELADVARPEQRDLAYRRRASVLRAMFEEGYITAEEQQRADAVSIEGHTRPRTANASVDVLVPDLDLEFFLDMVRRELVDRYGPRRPFAGGLEVHTTLDLEAQSAAIAARDVVVSQPDAPEVAVVVLDDQGHVRALVGGTDFGVSQVNLATGRRGGGGGRQAGSAMKPLVLAHTLASGVPLETTVESPGSVVVPKADGGQDWEVSNDGGRDLGAVDLREATVVSSNTAFASLSGLLDLDALVNSLGSYGIAAPLEPFPSVVLGAQEVSVIDMATGYSVLANGGELRRPIVISEVRDSEGVLVDRFSAQRSRVLDEAVATSVSDVMVQVVERGTGLGARVEGVTVAGKTGTSQSNRDAWFVGSAADRTVAVWMGYPADGRPMVDVLGVEAVTGGSYPASMFADIVRELGPPASS